MQSGLRFKEEGSRACTDIFMSDEAGNISIIGRNLLFTTFTREEISAHINDLQAYAKGNGLHLSGAVVIATYNEELEFKCIHVSNSNTKEDEVDTKVSTSKTDKPKKKKSLSVDQKLALIKEFYREKGSFPKPGDSYRDFKIGVFWANREKNKDVYDRIRRELE